MSDCAVWQVNEARKWAPEVQQALAPHSPGIQVVASEGATVASVGLSFAVSRSGVAKKLVLSATVFQEEQPAAAILAAARAQLVGFSLEAEHLH